MFFRFGFYLPLQHVYLGIFFLVCVFFFFILHEYASPLTRTSDCCFLSFSMLTIQIRAIFLFSFFDQIPFNQFSSFAPHNSIYQDFDSFLFALLLLLCFFPVRYFRQCFVLRFSVLFLYPLVCRVRSHFSVFASLFAHL